MLEQDIIGVLKSGELFADVKSIRIDGIEPQPRKGLFDLVFRLEFGTQGCLVYAEIKDACTPKQVEQIAPWLARLKAESKGQDAYALVCPVLSPAAQKICLENNVDFIDLAGNVSINIPGKFLLRIEGRKKRRPPTRLAYYRNPFSGKASRVIRVLLEKQREWSLTDVAQELSVQGPRNEFVKNSKEQFEISFASISKTLRSLEEELLVRRRNSSVLVPEPERLLLRWAEKYKERYRWFLRSSFESPNPFGKDIQAVKVGLTELVGPNGFAFTGVAAAATVAPFLDLGTIDLYVTSENVATRIRDLKPSIGIGPELRILYPYDTGVFLYAYFSDSLPLVSDVQIFLDLFARSGRVFKQAEYLLQERIRPRWRKV